MIPPAVVLLALLAVDDPGEARRLYEAGGQAYEQGRYPVAIDAFEAAYQRGPRAATAFSLAQSCRLQYFIDGDPRRLERAIAMYRAYLDLEPDGPRREHAAQHLATLAPILERLRRDGIADLRRNAAPEPARTQLIIACPVAGARVRVDGGEPEAAPAAFEVAPGKHHLEVEAAEHVTQRLDTVAVKGSVVALQVALEPLPATLEVRAPRGADVYVDGRFLGVAPLASPVTLPAGPHAVSLAARGRRPYLRELDLGRGQRHLLDGRLESTTQRWFAHGLFATGGALAGASVGLLAAAGVRGEEARSLEARTDAGLPLTVDEVDRHTALVAAYNDLVRAGATTTAIAAAATAIGLVLYFVDKPGAPPVVVAPTAQPGGAGVTLGGQF